MFTLVPPLPPVRAVPDPSGGHGSEEAEVVEVVARGATIVRPGDRVAYTGGPPGSYTEARVRTAGRLVPIPEWVTGQTAAAMILIRMTAQNLILRTYPVKAGETVLFHAAAGGVGLIACQLLEALGATVIGTVGSDEKAAECRPQSTCRGTGPQDPDWLFSSLASAGPRSSTNQVGQTVRRR
jgi:NADPH2:quinone reductase